MAAGSNLDALKEKTARRDDRRCGGVGPPLQGGAESTKDNLRPVGDRGAQSAGRDACRYTGAQGARGGITKSETFSNRLGNCNVIGWVTVSGQSQLLTLPEAERRACLTG